MARKDKKIVCSSCGFANTPPLANDRCVSCGAKVDYDPRQKGGQKDDLERRFQQEGFSLKWFAISLGVMTVMTAALVAGLPVIVPPLDFEGSAGMFVAVPVWFAGGVLVGLISPGRTFVEPMVAVFLVALPTAFLLYTNQTVKTMPAFMYALMSALGVHFSLIGSYVGERIQTTPARAR